MKHIQSCRTFSSFSSFGSHRSSVSVFLRKSSSYSRCMAAVMAGHMPYASAFWQLSLGRVVFSSQYWGDGSVISPIMFSSSSAVFIHARVRLRNSARPRRDDRQQFRRAGTLSLLHFCCEILLTEAAHWALLHALRMIYFLKFSF